MSAAADLAPGSRGSSSDLQAGAGTAGQRRAARSALWLDDLRWHKHMFRQSRFQWTGEHAVDIITRHTGGQVEFSTVRHLRRLQREQDEIADYTTQCRLAMGDALDAAAGTLVGGWAAVADAVGLDVGHAKAIGELASFTSAKERTNPDVRRVLRQLPFSNPLIQVWELKQLVNLFQAAVDLVEDTLCDLLDELADVHPPAVLMEAAGQQSLLPVARVDWARKARGGLGDPRRVPRQLF